MRFIFFNFRRPSCRYSQLTMSITNRTAFMKDSHLLSWSSLESFDSDWCSVEKQQTFIGNLNPSMPQWTLALRSVSPLDAMRFFMKNDCFPYLRNLNEILSSLEVCDLRRKRNEKTKPPFRGIKFKTTADFSKSIHLFVDCFCGRLMREISPLVCDSSTNRHIHSAVTMQPDVFQPLQAVLTCFICIFHINLPCLSDANFALLQQAFTSTVCSTVQRLPAYRSSRSEGFSTSPRAIQWVQLAGHEGSLISTGTGSVLKPYSVCEATCLRRMSELPALRSYVPRYQGDTTFNGKRILFLDLSQFTQMFLLRRFVSNVCSCPLFGFVTRQVGYLRMQDLLYKHRCLSVMDCKIGQRTYTEDEATTEETAMHCPRADMYEKMVTLDPDAPTLDEHRVRSVSKLRYMRWREAVSSTQLLGFRIEAVMKFNTPATRHFQLTRTWDQVKAVLRDFMQSRLVVCMAYLCRLQRLRKTLESSQFFAHHEFIGSSLLFAHDTGRWANVWMIDFGKTLCLPTNIRLNHRETWQLGNHEDGYLIGVDNLITLLQELCDELAVLPTSSRSV
ncbi:1D-myo-inositol-triphosphate 3-kinase [Paragonimus westermani]|uniref:Kinase n=1 Tax=Paragonimus westermani TaxID=34504 RepID=A0A5J4NQ84_9TREM|nr:1D-myo-inositol-triphosphate 3-kinase [Paragonimus westermani]